MAVLFHSPLFSHFARNQQTCLSTPLSLTTPSGTYRVQTQRCKTPSASASWLARLVVSGVALVNARSPLGGSFFNLHIRHHARSRSRSLTRHMRHLLPNNSSLPPSKAPFCHPLGKTTRDWWIQFRNGYLVPARYLGPVSEL